MGAIESSTAIDDSQAANQDLLIYVGIPVLLVVVIVLAAGFWYRRKLRKQEEILQLSRKVRAAQFSDSKSSSVSKKSSEISLGTKPSVHNSIP